MGDLSKYFSLWEFRCRCDEPHETKISNDLILGLEQFRFAANGPVYICSGYRCLKHNFAVSGTTRSFHLSGEAADVIVPGMAVRTMFYHARQIPLFRNGGIGVYLEEGFIHVDVRDGKARWARIRRGEPYTSIPKELY